MIGLGGLLALLLLPGIALPANADDPCAKFSWDARHERTLSGEVPQLLAAGKAPASSSAVSPDRLYRLQLIPQSQVSFAAPPGKRPSSDGAYAGLATLSLDKPGSYRISLDQPAWVDVVANGAVIDARDFQGRRGCNAPHKIVAFELPAGTRLTLQFSASTSAALLMAVSRSPAQGP